MAEITVKLPYGREMVEVKIPRANLVGIYSPRDFKPVANVKDEIVRAINNPIASKPLRQLVTGAKKSRNCRRRQYAADSHR